MKKVIKKNMENSIFDTIQHALTVIERLSGKLDVPYIEDWARRLGISNELDYILNL